MRLILVEDEKDLGFIVADRSRNTGGSGLGLAIALAITQTHKGKLEVESQVDHGSTFTLSLPLVSTVNK